MFISLYKPGFHLTALENFCSGGEGNRKESQTGQINWLRHKHRHVDTNTHTDPNLHTDANRDTHILARTHAWKRDEHSCDFLLFGTGDPSPDFRGCPEGDRGLVDGEEACVRCVCVCVCVCVCWWGVVCWSQWILKKNLWGSTCYTCCARLLPIYLNTLSIGLIIFMMSLIPCTGNSIHVTKKKKWHRKAFLSFFLSWSENVQLTRDLQPPI